MSNDGLQPADTLLRLKAKAAQGVSWTKEERAFIESCFETGGTTSVLAACCVLSSQRPKGCSKSVGILREAIERKHLPPYAEMSVYEALIYVEPHQLESFYDAIFHFVEQSLAKRAVNLDNTVVLLGNLARYGENRALVLLRSLEHDKEHGLRDNASLVIRGIESQ